MSVFTFQFSALGTTAAVHSADYSRSRRIICFSRGGLIHPDEELASFAGSCSTEHIWLAEVESYTLHASMSCRYLDRQFLLQLVDQVITTATEDNGIFATVSSGGESAAPLGPRQRV